MNKKGFTLIELLIVIAVLGTLAVVVLIALNPVQQLARTRDAGRDSTVNQLGRAMEARGTILGGQYPALGAGGAGGWITDLLVSSGEITTVPSAVTYSAGSATACGGQNGYCYATNRDSFVIYATAEAESNLSQCASGTAYFVYNSLDGRGGLACLAAAPSAGTATGSNYVQ